MLSKCQYVELDEIPDVERRDLSGVGKDLDPVGDQTADSLGREMRMLDDRQPPSTHELTGRGRSLARLDVAIQNQRLLRQIEIAGIHEHVPRCRKAL